MANLVFSKLFHYLNNRPSSCSSSSPYNNPKKSKIDSIELDFEDFRRDVSKLLNQLFNSDSKSVPIEELIISLPWIQKCLETLRKVNAAFAKLVVEMDYHPLITQLAVDDSIEGYLNYTLNLSHLLNSITSSLSHLRHASLCSSHALTILKASPNKAADRLRRIRFRHLHKHSSAFQEYCEEKQQQQGDCNYQGKEEELIIRRALMIVRGIGYWVCGIVLSGLSGDSCCPYYLDMRRWAADGLDHLELEGMDDIVAEAVAGGNGLAREITDVDCAVARVVAAVDDGGGVAAEEVGKKLKEMDSVLDNVGKEAEGLFSEIMSGRNLLMDLCLRRRRNYF